MYFISELTLPRNEDTEETAYLNQFIDKYVNAKNDDDNADDKNNNDKINISFVIETICEHENIKSLDEFLKIKTTRNMFMIFLAIFREYKSDSAFGMTKKDLYEIWKCYAAIKNQPINFDAWKKSIIKNELLTYDLDLFEEVLKKDYDYIIKNFDQFVFNDHTQINKYLSIMLSLPNIADIKSQILELVSPIFIKDYSNKNEGFHYTNCDGKLLTMLLDLNYIYTTNLVADNIQKIYICTFDVFHTKKYEIFKYFFTNDRIVDLLKTKQNICNNLILKYVKENNADYVEVLLKSFTGEHIIHSEKYRGSLKFDVLHYAEFYENEKMIKLLTPYCDMANHDTIYGEFIKTGIDVQLKYDNEMTIIECCYNSDDLLSILYCDQSFAILVYGRYKSNISNMRHMCASYKSFVFPNTLTKVFVIYTENDKQHDHIKTDLPDIKLTELIPDVLYYHIVNGKLYFLYFEDEKYDMLWFRGEYLVFDHLDKRLKKGKFHSSYITINDENLEEVGMTHIGDNIFNKDERLCIKKDSYFLKGKFIRFDLMYKLIEADFNKMQLMCQINWNECNVNHINKNIKDLKKCCLTWNYNNFSVSNLEF